MPIPLDPRTGTVSWLRNPNTGLIDPNYYNVPPTSDTDYLFGSAYLPSATTFTATAYWPDVSQKTVVQNWNTAYPGLEWTQPFYFYGANGPVIYEIVEGVTGMTIGNKMVRDPITGFFRFDQFYGVLKWENPIAGDYRVIIRATDQLGRVATWVFRLNVNALLNFFVALNATGLGDGSSPSNYAAWTSTILGQTTNSPSKGKVLRIKGDEYPVNAGLRLDTSYVAASWCAMPAETPKFLQKFVIGSNNINLHGLEFEGVGTSGFGIVDLSGIQNRIGVWGCEFDECYIIGASGANQACIGANMSALSSGRERIFVADCIFRNTTSIHGFDFYSMRDYTFIRNRKVVTNGTTVMDPSWVFPKVQANGGEIMFNEADVPTITSTEVGIFQIHNGWEPSNTNVFDMRTRVEHNFVRTGGANVCRVGSDTDEAVSVNFIDTWIKRNTFVGEYVGATNYSIGTNTTRRNYWESNIAINNRNSNAGGIVTDVGDTITGENIFGPMSALGTLLDANFAPADTSKYGLTGRDIWRPL